MREEIKRIHYITRHFNIHAIYILYYNRCNIKVVMMN